MISGETSATLNLATAGAAINDTLSVEVRANDGDAESGSAQADRTVTAANRPPVAGSASLSPAAPRTDQTLTATRSGFTDPDGDPLTYRYTWKRDGTILTDETSPTLDLSKPGNGDKGQQLTVEIRADDGQIESAPAVASVTVINSTPSLTLSAFEVNAAYSDAIAPVTVQANDPDGDPLTFSSSDLPGAVSLATTSPGQATISGRLAVPAGTQLATIGVTDGAADTTRNLRFLVRQESAQVRYVGPRRVSTGSRFDDDVTVTLSARVTQEDDGTPGDLSRGTVAFDLYSSSNSSMLWPDRACWGTVSANGSVSCSVRNLPADVWTVVPRMRRGNRYFRAPVDSASTLLVFRPTTTRSARGAGTVTDPGSPATPAPVAPDNAAGEFGFNVVRTGSGTRATGDWVYLFHGTDGNTYVFKRQGWTDGTLTFPSASSTTFAGRARMLVIDADGFPVPGRNRTDLPFRADGRQGARLSPAAGDAFAIAVQARDGSILHRAGTPGALLPVLDGGLVLVP